MVSYKAGIFDLGLTLIYSPRDEDFMRLCAMRDMFPNKEAVNKAHTFTDNYFMKNKPGILAQDPKEFYMEYLAILFAYLHLEPDIEDFYKLTFEIYPPRVRWELYDETISFLEAFKERGMKIGLLTNWDLGARKLLESLNLIEYFDSVKVSSEMGVEKPALEAFTQSMEDLQVKAHETFYVGDNYYDDVHGGNEAGLKVFLINRSDIQHEKKEGNYIEIHSLMELFNYI